MPLLFLIRHGDNDSVGRGISGRRAGLHLNRNGQQQAARLADWLGESGIEGIYSSPLERARETAQPLADRLALPVQVLPGLNEIDFGEWEGLSFDRLAGMDQWRRFNEARSLTRIPGGERMAEVQVRMVNTLDALCRHGDAGAVAVVSHGDPIRAALLHYLGMPLDFVHRIEIDLASVSIVALDGWTPRVLTLNAVPDGPRLPS